MKIVKSSFVLSILFTALVGILFGGCTPQGSFNDDPASSFTIRVTDNKGFRPSGGKGVTIAPDHFKTHFTVGDQIGVYGVRNNNNQIDPDINNLCITALGSGGSVLWTTDDAKMPLLLDKDITFYAYYPYDKNTSIDLVDPSADNAPDFFKKMIAGWTPPTDQSDLSRYGKADLMVARGQQTPQSMTFPMTHTMSLVLMNFAGTAAHYQFINTTPTLSDYAAAAPPLPGFDGFTPLQTDFGSYRYIVNPQKQTAGSSLSGGYLYAHSKWQFSIDGIAVAGSLTATIDRQRTINVDQYELKPGDFLLDNGVLIGVDQMKKLTPVLAKKVLGVVGYVGRAAKDQDTYTRKDGTTPLSEIHAYVVAEYPTAGFTYTLPSDPGQMTWCYDNGSLRYDSKYNVGTYTADLDLCCGYSDSGKIEKRNRELDPSDLSLNFPALYFTTVDYESKYPAPDYSSGWFMASAGEIRLLTPNWITINHALFAASSSSQGSDQSLWSTTEFKQEGVNYDGARVIDPDTGKTDIYSFKVYPHSSRAFFVF